MQSQFKNITEQFEDIVGTVRTRIVDTNEYVADTVSPYLNTFGENVSKTAESVSDQVTKTIDGLDLPKVELPKVDLQKIGLPEFDLPKIDRPDLSKLPTASKIVDTTFGFVADGVEANRKFVSELVGAWSPVADEPAEKVAAKKPAAKKPATKASAKKVAAKKPAAKKPAAKKATKASAKK